MNTLRTIKLQKNVCHKEDVDFLYKYEDLINSFNENDSKEIYEHTSTIKVLRLLILKGEQSGITRNI